jgi:nitrate/nitrite transporter NarK
LHDIIGTAADTEKKAVGMAATLHTGLGVGAPVAGTVVPWVMAIVSIEMSPVNEVVRLATHRADVVPGDNCTMARVQAPASEVCCWPVMFHCVTHTVPVQVWSERVPMVAPNM